MLSDICCLSSSTTRVYYDKTAAENRITRFSLKSKMKNVEADDKEDERKNVFKDGRESKELSVWIGSLEEAEKKWQGVN